MSTTGTFKPSTYQQAIFDAIENPAGGNLIVEAVAGSGKSTTLVQATKRISGNKQILFVAFNKRVVEDLKPKLPSNANALTLNSLGHRAWSRFTSGDLTLDADKIYKLVDEFFPEGKLSREARLALMNQYRAQFGDSQKELMKYEAGLEKVTVKHVYDLRRLVDLAKGAGLVPETVAKRGDFKVLMEDCRENWMGFIDEFDLDFERPDVAITLAPRILARSIELAGERIDFNDQLYMPVITGAAFPKYDWVFVDEAQDLNAIQHTIVSECMGPRSRMVAVGDSRQAIYAFRGSLSDSMQILRDRFDARELPLSICYRCGKKIVELAQSIVPHIEPHADKWDGHIEHLEVYGPQHFGPKDVVICRNMFPLVQLTYNLIRAKVPCRILGKDLEHGLISMIKKIGGQTIDQLEERIEEYVKKEAAKLERRGQTARIAALNDRVATLQVFIDELPQSRRTIDSLKKAINDLFKMDQLEKKQMLVLSTIHRTKGGEWDNVFLLDSHLMPSQYAKTDEALRQENNLRYVAYTRAIRRLIFIDSEGFSAEAKVEPAAA